MLLGHAVCAQHILLRETGLLLVVVSACPASMQHEVLLLLTWEQAVWDEAGQAGRKLLRVKGVCPI